MSEKDGFLLPYQYDYELAKLARAIYEDEDTIRKSMEQTDPDKRLLPDGWEILPDSFYDTNAKTGFVAGAFQNRNTKEIVIAYRGSEPTGPTAHGLIDYKGANAAIAADGDMRGLTDSMALHAAGQLLARQQLTDWHAQFEQGLDYAERILKQSQTMPGGPYTVHVTGHSLAGAIAQVTHEMFDLPGRTFDPGGAANLTYSDEFKAWRSQYYLHRDDGLRRANRDPEGRDFSNYLVNDSLVSRYSGSHVGRVEDVTGYGGRETFGDKAPYHVKRLLDGPVGAIGSGFNVIELHDMDRIIRVFKEAQQTGELNRLGDLTPQSSEPDILRPGEQGRAVANLQSGLIQLGYHRAISQPLQVNGVNDDATREAVTAFQAKHDLPITSTLDAATQQALQQMLLAQQQATEQRQTEDKAREKEQAAKEQTRSEELLPYSDPNSPLHAHRADFAQRSQAAGVNLTEEQLTLGVAQMQAHHIKPGWEGGVTVHDGILYVSQYMPPEHFRLDTRQPAPPVQETLQQAAIQQREQAEELARMEAMPKIHGPTLGPGGPSGMPSVQG